MAHLINRLQMEVQCADEAQAFDLRHNFGVTLQEQMIEVIDVVCSQYVSEEEWLRIDKLEINIGHFNQLAFDENFAAVFKYQFEKELKGKLSHLSPEQKKASRQLSRIELLQYFLQKGTLPWWAAESSIDLDEISADLLAHQPAVLSYFFYQHRFAKNVWKRIALQLNKATKAAIINLVEELQQAKVTLSLWLQHLLSLIKNKTISQPAFDESKIDDVILYHTPLIFQSPENKMVLWKIIGENIEVISPENKTWMLQLMQDNETMFLNSEKAVINDNKAKQSGTNKALNEKQIRDTLIDELLSQPPSEENEEAEKYFVKGAGIVLLALFLKPFFTNLQLLHNGEWKDKDAQYKAIHLLKYLSTGRQKIREYDLTLEKVICGVAIEEPIPIEITLSEAEITEAESLLSSVIEHWKALKNTSVNGLREAFLKRDGLLKKRENNWLLQVERKTLDVLIDSIPWGYSTITFSWNAYFLFVEW